MYQPVYEYLLKMFLVFILPMALHAFWQEEITPRLQNWRARNR